MRRYFYDEQALELLYVPNDETTIEEINDFGGHFKQITKEEYDKILGGRDDA